MKWNNSYTRGKFIVLGNKGLIQRSIRQIQSHTYTSDFIQFTKHNLQVVHLKKSCQLTLYIEPPDLFWLKQESIDFISDWPLKNFFTSWFFVWIRHFKKNFRKRLASDNTKLSKMGRNLSELLFYQSNKGFQREREKKRFFNSTLSTIVFDTHAVATYETFEVRKFIFGSPLIWQTK